MMPQTIGAFLFPAVLENWTRMEAERQLKSLIDVGVNTLITEAETYDDSLIDLAHRLGMRFVGGISCFSDHRRKHQLLFEKPELWPVLENGERRQPMEWYIGVTPTFEDYNQSRLDAIEHILQTHELDGFCLDFIRWPLHWELELRPTAPKPLESSFDAHTVSRFLRYANLELPDALTSVAEQAAWILDNHRAAWTYFKCHVITDFVAQARDRVRASRKMPLGLGVYLVPAPEEQCAELVGQRVSDLEPLVDFIAPMDYHAILHRTTAWVEMTNQGIIALAPGKVLPVLQVDSAEGAEKGADWGPPIPIDEWRQLACDTTKHTGLQGLIAFTGTALFRDDRGVVLADCLRKNYG
jgi:hypothetical protein